MSIALDQQFQIQKKGIREERIPILVKTKNDDEDLFSNDEENFVFRILWLWTNISF